MPSYGILPVTVPGTVWGWQAALQRFGKLTFKEVLEPAARYAQNGFPGVASGSHTTGVCRMRCPRKAAARSRIPIPCGPGIVNGQPPAAGQIFRNPDLARTLRLLQTGGAPMHFTEARSRRRSSRNQQRSAAR